ncbi:MAG: valine--tRNA ligase [Candidatus Nanoarchaeia archaeon]
MELPKNYETAESEKKLTKYWHEKGIYQFDEQSKKEIYSIDTPPPYASADHLHVGHAMHYSQFEFMARYKKMRGFNVFFPMGYDDNGLPTERFVEKKHNVNKSTITRADFIKLCLDETKRCGQVYYNLFTKLGFSIDWSLLFQTIDERSRRVSQTGFIELYKKGLMKHEELPTTWCMTCQTTIAQADFENVDIQSHFNDIIFKCGNTDLIIATTRPELIPACVGLFAHPDDERYKNLKGKEAEVPLCNHKVPILFDESVDKEKGTGLMMCCTFGDKDDIEKWYKFKLPLKIIFTEDGRINETVPQFKGLKIKEARAKIIEELKEHKFLVNQKQITHPVNVHERCGTEIEFLKKKQWSIIVLNKKEELIQAADKIKWYPEHMKIRYEHWVRNLQWDWGISRQRYYGVPFPLWHCKKCGKVNLPEINDLPVDPREQNPKKTCSCGNNTFAPEMDVMDTWMTSSMTPYINAHWKMSDERKNFVPMSLRPQAHDIIRTWAFYTIVKAHFLENNIPWETIMISGHGQDPHGKKMSKSKGNFIVADEVITKFGADALRYWAAGAKLGEDMPYQEKDVLTGKKTVTKLWNASKFTIMNLEGYKASSLKKTDMKNLEVLDKWLLSKLMKIIKTSTDSFDKYEYSAAKRETDVFFWQSFCDNYLEFIKHRTYNAEDESSKLAAQKTLYYALLSQLKLFAPIMPFITEEIYLMYFKDIEKTESIHVSEWPEYDESLIDEEAEKTGDLVVQVIAEARKYKSTKQLSLKAEITKATITGSVEQLKMLEKAVSDIKKIGLIKDLELREGETFEVAIE